MSVFWDYFAYDWDLRKAIAAFFSPTLTERMVKVFFEFQVSFAIQYGGNKIAFFFLHVSFDFGDNLYWEFFTIVLSNLKFDMADQKWLPLVKDFFRICPKWVSGCFVYKTF